MTPRHLFFLIASTALLAACSSGPVRKVHPSTVSIQQLAAPANGSWKITLRIQNYSTFPMHYSKLDVKLHIDDKDAGDIAIVPDMDILGSSGDVIDATLTTNVRLPSNGDFAYQLKGTIETSEPKDSFKLDTSSRLSPVPGIANTWR